MTSTTDNDLPDGWEASSITVADEQVAYCISSSTQPDRQVYLTASGALGITAAGDGCWAPARAVAHVLSRADVDSTKAALVLPRGMSAAEAQALLDVAAEAVGYVGEPGTPERQRWADDVMVMGACRETDANKALRSAAREYAKAWDDYKNESRKSAAVGALESAARAFAAATPPHQVETHAGAGREHELKTWPPYFEGVVDGSKTFEVRREDRPFAVGDVLVLREWDPKLERYTGRSTKRSITYLMRGGRFGLERGYVVLGLAAATARNESANADTIAAAAIAYARAVDAADEKSRTAEEYEAANAEARRRLVAAVQREVPATRLFFAAR